MTAHRQSVRSYCHGISDSTPTFQSAKLSARHPLLSLVLSRRHTASPYSPTFPRKKPAAKRAVFVVSIFGYAPPFRLLQGRLSTRHDACWSQTRQGDDLSPQGFVRPVSCVHLLRSFCEPFGSGRFLRELGRSSLPSGAMRLQAL